MFEEQTFENIMSRMLDNEILEDVDKREGSIIYDTLAPAAAELAQLYMALDVVISEFDITTASRGYLIKHGLDYDISPYEAEAEIVRAKFKPATVDVIGKTFSFEDRRYIAVQKLTDGEYLLQCTTTGFDGSEKKGTLLPTEEIPGLESASLTGTESFGSDEEDTEDFRKRLLDNIKTPAFGGNVTDYENKVLAVGGVGMVKITPCNDGENSTPGHVLVEILDDNYDLPSEELINSVQKTLTGSNSGNKGYGVAPIGHSVHVQKPKAANITFIMGLFCNHSDVDNRQEEIKVVVKNALAEYFYQMRDTWFKTKGHPTSTIYTLTLLSYLMNLDEVSDVHNLSIRVDDDEEELYNASEEEKNLVPYFYVEESLPVLDNVEIVFWANGSI